MSKLIFALLVGAFSSIILPNSVQAGFIPNTNSCPAGGQFEGSGCNWPGSVYIGGNSCAVGYDFGPTDKNGNQWCVQKMRRY